MKKWVIHQPDAAAVSALTRGTDLTSLCASVLAARGIHTVEAAAAFLNTDALSDPFLIRDMREAVDCINEAIETGVPICIYGDYDCDGVTATAMLYSYLECCGADVRYYIPEREEGYGMNPASIRKLAEEGVSLIITVDNGISAIAEAKLAAALGMQLVITDHHQAGDTLPEAVAVVNPHRPDCPSPYKSLCGAGVVLKLIAALDGGDCDVALEQFGDLAAIGTIADIVTLDGENRFLVQRGLAYLQNTEREGLLALLEASGLAEKPVDAHTVGFMLAPRLNAAGRFGSPKQAVELLLCDDPATAAELAAALNTLNAARKKTEAEIREEISAALQADPTPLRNRILVLWGNGWHHGVIGIVAARLQEQYGKPVFLLSVEDGEARGSARASGDFSVYRCLAASADLLTHWGGHQGAGGLSLPAQALPALNERIQAYAAETFPTGMPVYTLEAHLLQPAHRTPEQVAGLSLLEPFGAGNVQPLFAMLGAQVLTISATKNGAHTLLRLRYGTETLTAFWFFRKPASMPFAAGDTCDFLAVLTPDSYNGRPGILTSLRDGRKSGIRQAAYFAARDTYEAYCRDEALPPAYYGRMIPTREELIAVYQALPPESISFDALLTKLPEGAMNYCKLRLCCDIFTERGLAAQDYAGEAVTRLPATKKVDITASAVLLALQQKAAGTMAHA